MTSSLPAAVLWDYDGTLVDTQPIWCRVEKEIVRSHGGVWTDQQARDAVGVSGEEAVRRLAAAIGREDLSLEELEKLRLSGVTRAVAAIDLPYLPGARELLDDCAAAGLRCALVSASPRSVLAAGLDRMPAHWFTRIVSGDDVCHHKPDPEPYLKAAALLGADPADCLVIDDSEPGCAAGRASGAAVLAVPNMTALDPRPGQVIRSSLAGLRALDLAGVWAQAKAGPAR